MITQEERNRLRNLPFVVGDLVLIETICGLIPAKVTKVGRRGGVTQAERRESRSTGILGSVAKIPEWITTFTKPKDADWTPCGQVSAELLDGDVDHVIAELPSWIKSHEEAKECLKTHLTAVGREVWGLHGDVEPDNRQITGNLIVNPLRQRFYKGFNIQNRCIAKG